MTGSAEIRKTGRKPANTNVCRSPRVYPKFRLGGGLTSQRNLKQKSMKKTIQKVSLSYFCVLQKSLKVFASQMLQGATGTLKMLSGYFFYI